MVNLEKADADVAKEFFCGNFAVQILSAIAVNQVHEQNNAVIK